MGLRGDHPQYAYMVRLVIIEASCDSHKTLLDFHIFVDEALQRTLRRMYHVWIEFMVDVVCLVCVLS